MIGRPVHLSSLLGPLPDPRDSQLPIGRADLLLIPVTVKGCLILLGRV